MKIERGPMNFFVEKAITKLNNSDKNSTSNKTTNFSFTDKLNTKKSIPALKEEDCIKWFSELHNKDVAIAGGKGASLGEMFNNKFPVPNGYVITAQAYDFFIKKNGLDELINDIIKNTDVDDTEKLNSASKKIREIIEKEQIPEEIREIIIESYHILNSEKIDRRLVSEQALSILKNSQEPIFVSVRSSATTEDLANASFAGQQESFLNVKGDKSLLEYVKKCFSSLYTPRAIYYRNKKGFSEASIAVVVQRMIDSEKSGVIFSKDPVNENNNITIEAVFGLGEGIVSGRINPDHYTVLEELKIKEIKIGNKKIAIVRSGSGENEIVRLNEIKRKSQVLNTAEILEAANYAIRLEEHYGKPQDIEFAIENKNFYIIQSRPITTLNKKYEKKELVGKLILEGLGAGPGIGVGVVKIIYNIEDLTKIKKGDILVATSTNPDMVVSMQKSSAIITDEGGLTSHAAIVSREMGIPAVVGTERATSTLKDGMRITVDGFNGRIYEGEVAETTMAEIKPVVNTERVKLKIILDLPDFAERASKAGITSVGLLRLEGIIASSGKHPLLFEKENKLGEYSRILETGINKIAKHFNSIWIRTSDIRTDEFSSLKGSPEKEINPMLGFHGIRFSLKHPEILKTELNAIKNTAVTFPQKKFGVMFPQIISIEEVKKAKEYFNEFKTPNMNFGVMIETPASVQLIEDISDEVDFISLGTNDLTQYTLAVDRGESNVQYLYNELHPAIFSQIKRVINACRRKKVETSICGQAGSKKEMVEFLFRKGINSISVNADSAYEISNFIKSLEDEWKKIREERMSTNYNKKNQSDNLNFNKKWNKKANTGFESEVRENFEQMNNQKNKELSKIRIIRAIPVSEEINDNKESLLDKNKIKVSAELFEENNFDNDKYSYEENIGPIEPFNDLKRVEKEAKKIQQEVKQDNLEKLQEKNDN